MRTYNPFSQELGDKRLKRFETFNSRYKFEIKNKMFVEDRLLLLNSAQVEVPNSQRISCLDSSLGRASACGAGGRSFAPRP